MKYRKFVKYLHFIIALLSLIIFSFVIFVVIDQMAVTHASINTINDGWVIECKGQIFNSPDITLADIGVINESEKVTISRVLPDVGLSNPCLSFYSVHSIVNVYLDKELIYSYGQEYYDTKNMLPNKSHFIALGNDYTGKTLKIEIIGGKKAAFSYLSPVYIDNRLDILIHDYDKNAISILVGIFLFTFAVILIIVSPYLFVFHSNDLRILFSGLISLMLGTYILSSNMNFDLLLNNGHLNIILEYCSLYNIPTMIVGYLLTVFKGKSRKIFIAIFSINISLFILAKIAHALHIAKFYDFASVLHVLSAIELVIAVIIIYKNYASAKKASIKNVYFADNIFLFGLVAFMILSLVDIVSYNLVKYNIINHPLRIPISGTTLGALIFIICLMISYLYYSVFSLNIASMQSKIKDLAYTDALTGLANRARCEQLMQMISERNGTYAIISLDLNRLKYVNDNLGHHEGDRLLTGFATILSDCFWDANLVGRMGGDEFIVIFMEDRILNLTRRIHELYSMINDWNHKEQAFQYSTSYGYAYSYEVPNGSAKEVYMLADNRMYEMKREHHIKEDQEVMSNA